MLSLERNGYTKQQVIDALHGKYKARELSFRYELLDKNDIKKKNLDTVVSGEVSMSALAQIKRTARFQIKEDPTINYLSDRIKPIARINMGNVTEEKATTWKEFPIKNWSDL